LATDVVGFYRLMRMDEKSTITALAERRKFSNALIVRNGGGFFTPLGSRLWPNFPAQWSPCALLWKSTQKFRH